MSSAALSGVAIPPVESFPSPAPRLAARFVLPGDREKPMSVAQRHAADTEIDAVTILDQLTYYEGLPRAALQAASKRRAEVVPLFIGEIEKYLSADAARRKAPTPLFFIFHLLGDWREQSAYRPLARLLRCGSDDIDSAIEDAITITSHRVMAAVFDGDPQPLHDVVLDPGADEFIRAHMLQTLVMPVLDGRLPRQGLEHFLRDCFTHDRTGNQFCLGWLAAGGRKISE
jgi:hypothetical protein